MASLISREAAGTLRLSRAAVPDVFRGVLLLFALGFLAVLVVRPNGESGLIWFSDITLSSTTMLAGTMTLFLAARMHGPDRLSWILMGLATLSWGLGMVVWSFYELVLRQETPFPSLADLGYLGMLPLMVAGLVTLPVGRIPPEGRIKTIVDAILIMASIATVSWFTILGPIYSQADATVTEKVIGIAYPAGDVILVFALLGGLARGWIGARNPAVMPLVIGITLFTVSDLGFNYLTIHDAYASGNPIDLGWSLGFLLVAYAAVRRWAKGAAAATDGAESPVAPGRPSPWRLAAPYVVVVGVALLLFYSRVDVRGSEQNVFVGLALVTMMLVLARQFITVRENEMLNRELLSFSQSLETTVEQRTGRLAALHGLASALSAASAREQLPQILEDAVQLVAANLQVEFCQILELDADGRTWRVGAAVGWAPVPPARSELRVSRRREAGFALRARTPVVMEDARSERRFVPLDADHTRGIVSGVSVVIPPPTHPFGVLSVHATSARSFTQDEIHFLQSVANVLGQAIDRIRAEEEVRRGHAYTEQLLESIPSLLIGVGPNGLVQIWNKAAEETFGLSSEQIVRKPFSAAPVEFDWGMLARAVESCLADGKPVRLEDVPVGAALDRRLYLSLVVNPILDESGNKAGYLIIGVDVTERRVLEAQLTQAQKLESIGQLAAGIAHEINTPTQYIGDNTRFLQDAFRRLDGAFARYEELLVACESGEPTPALVDSIRREIERTRLAQLRDEIPPAIQDSLDGVDRVARIVRAMKKFSHPGSESKAPIDVNEAIESTVTVASSEWKHVAELELDFDPSLPLVPCLPGEFNQVILNLVVNAADAIADAGKQGLGKLSISTRAMDNFVEVRVSDSGCGIPPEIQSRIYDPFFTTKEVGRGTGQGLAISRSVIVDKHGGTIAFETEKHRGTTFIIRIPLGEAQSRAA